MNRLSHVVTSADAMAYIDEHLAGVPVGKRSVKVGFAEIQQLRSRPAYAVWIECHPDLARVVELAAQVAQRSERRSDLWESLLDAQDRLRASMASDLTWQWWRNANQPESLDELHLAIAAALALQARNAVEDLHARGAFGLVDRNMPRFNHLLRSALYAEFSSATGQRASASAFRERAITAVDRALEVFWTEHELVDRESLETVRQAIGNGFELLPLDDPLDPAFSRMLVALLSSVPTYWERPVLTASRG